MKRIYAILLSLLMGGCATTSDLPTMNILINRMDSLEKQMKIQPPPINEIPKEYNGNPNRLNDAQKDFVQFMLNYLADEG